jgi:glutamate-1-semialdehyde 2,1-aminomutase
MQEFHQRGILSMGTHNISHAHTAQDVASLLDVYAVLLPKIGELLKRDQLRGALRCAPLVPLFKLR